MFSRGEFETALYSLTVKDDYTAVAGKVGVSPGIMSQWFNPNELRESILFKAGAIFVAWIEQDAARGREMFRRFCSFVERAFPETDLTERGRLLASVEKTEAEIAEVKRLALAMPMRQVAQTLVADRCERRRAAA